MKKTCAALLALALMFSFVVPLPAVAFDGESKPALQASSVVPPVGDPGHGHHGSGETTAVARIDGESPFAVSLSASASSYATGAAESVVIVNPAVSADAVPAAALAGACGGPLLLTGQSSLPDGTVDELRRLGASRVYIVGSSASVSTNVGYKLKAAGYSVVRVTGENRSATAAAVARRVAAILGVASIDTAFVVHAGSAWDGLVATPYAYGRNIPILFVGSAGVPAATARTISALHVRRLIVVGSTSVVPGTTFKKLAALTSGSDVRIGGSTRFNTAGLLADYAVSSQWVSAAHVVVAGGSGSFANAIPAGGIGGKHGAALLLATQDALPLASKGFLTDHKTHVSHVAVVGRAAVISDDVMAEIRSALTPM